MPLPCSRLDNLQTVDLFACLRRPPSQSEAMLYLSYGVFSTPPPAGFDTRDHRLYFFAVNATAFSFAPNFAWIVFIAVASTGFSIRPSASG